MEQYINKDALVAEIEKLVSNGKLKCQQSQENNDRESYVAWSEHIATCGKLLSLLDTLEVKRDEDNSLEKFKSLQHITKDLHQTLEDWGYAPNLYFFDGMWHISWISCEEGDGIKDFEGSTPEEAIDKAYDWFHSTFCNA